MEEESCKSSGRSGVCGGIRWRMDAATARCECPRAMCSSTFIDEMDRTDAYHISAGLRTSVGVARQKSMDGLKHTEPEQP